MTKLYEKRFEELESQILQIESTQQQKYSEYSGNYIHIDSNLLLNWKVKVKNLLISVCGEKSQHFTSFLEAEKPMMMESSLSILYRINAVFLAAKEDF